MYYAGESNVPGAPGNLVAGVNFPLSQEEFRDMVERRMDEKRFKQLSAPGGPLEGGFLEYIRKTGNYPPVRGASAAPPLPGSSNLPGAAGNMAGLANATFYAGPQYNQPSDIAAIPGFQGKYVY